jgi:hypothetical protein
MLKKAALTLLAVGAMTASAATYRVSLHQDSIVNGQSLKAGDYKVEVKDNNTAVISKGKQTFEVPVQSVDSGSKFASTQVQYNDSNKLQEIRVGGTSTKLVFGGTNSTATGM